MSEFRDHVASQLESLTDPSAYIVRDTLLILRDALQAKVTMARTSGTSKDFRAGLTEAVSFMDNLIRDVEQDYLD